MAELHAAYPLALDEDEDDESEEHEPFEVEHDSNLADCLPPEHLSRIANQLVGDIDADERSCKPAMELIKKGLDLLGAEILEMTEPFPDACSAVYPLMLEAAIQFQARAIAELFPSTGPVKTQIVGDSDHDRVRQAERVREFMNYQLTEVMDEYYDELDQMLMALPILGSCFKKIYFDPSLGRPVSRYIPPENFVISYYSTDLRTTGRYTHITTIEANELKKLQKAGVYCDIPLTAGRGPEQGPVAEKISTLEGRTPSPETDVDRYTLMETHVDLDLVGFEDEDEDGEPTGIKLPYVVIIEKNSHKILSIRRNWDERDPLRRRLQWFVHYKYLPGLGFYGWGLIHILGNLQKSATAILRSLVDAGQFATLPAGFKARGARILEGDKPVSFGEWRDVDNFGDDLGKAMLPIPTKEPSQTLYQLLQTIVDAARRLASIADMNVGDNMKDQQPVGSTLAMLEQATKVMSAIHKRIHRAQREELRILARIDSINLPDFYPYDVEGATREIKQIDFDERVAILPVSDPNVWSETQRILRAQAMLQLATQLPQVHNTREAAYRMHEAIGTQHIDEVLNPDVGPKAMDPATEDFAMMQGKPAMVYAYQDHKAHIAEHMSFMSDPQYGANPVIQQQLLPVMMAHIASHEAWTHVLELQAMTGQALPDMPHYDPTNPNRPDGYQSMPPMYENQVARMQAQAAQQISQMRQQLAQVQQNQQMMQNPMVQLEQQKLQVDQFDSQTKRIDVMAKHSGASQQMEAQAKQQELAMKREEHAMNMRHEQEKMVMEQRKLAMQAQMDQAQNEMDLRKNMQKAAVDMETAKVQAQAQQQAAQLGAQTKQSEAHMKMTQQQQAHDQTMEMQREQHQQGLAQQKEAGQAKVEQTAEQGAAKVQATKQMAKAKAKPKSTANE